MSDNWQQPGAGSDAEDDDDDTSGGSIALSGRDGIVYMIDAASAVANPEHLDTLLAIIEASLLNRIIQAGKDVVGICAYNTEHSPAPAGSAIAQIQDAGRQLVPAGTAIIWPVQVISKSCITFIKNWRASVDQHDFAGRYGARAAPELFAEALWLCSRMLAGCDYKLHAASLVLFTNEEAPLAAASAAEQQKVFIRARDLHALNVDLMLVPLVDEFDVQPFYRELICTVHDLEESEFRQPAPADQRENLCMRAFQRDYRRACLRYFRLQLGDGLEIGCGTYGLARTTRVPGRVHLMAATNELVQARRCYVHTELDEQGEVLAERMLLPGELTKYMEVGGQKVRFSVDEMAQMRGIMAPGMKLLGFKPLAALPRRSFVKPSRLLYPSERSVKGSTRVFRALWQRCAARQVFALCVFAQVRKVAPRYVALVPQTEKTDGCDGFRIVYLPMQTDIRELDVFDRPVPTVPDGGSELMRTVARKLRFNYEPRIFEDPQLQNFYATLEALVYDEPKVQVEDTTLPDVEHQDRRLGELCTQMAAIFGEDSASGGGKRAADESAEGGSQAGKVPRLAPSAADIETAIRSGAANKLTVANLRDHLLAIGYKGATNKLKKQELIDVIAAEMGV